MKIAINTCHGGFGLSAHAYKAYANKKGLECHFFSTHPSTDGEYLGTDPDAYELEKGWWTVYTTDEPDFERLKTPDEDGLYKSANEYSKTISLYLRGEECRTDPVLIEVIEELGEKANGPYASLEIIEIPDAVEWYIDDYDGVETIHENHQSWG